MTFKKYKKILIIDDDPDIVNYIRLEATREGLECETAITLNDVSDLLENNQFDLIFLDIILGKNKTSEDIATILRYPPYDDIPIIIMSAYINQEFSDKIKNKWKNIKNTLQKPFERGDISSAILKVQTSDREEINSALLTKETSTSDKLPYDLLINPDKSTHIDQVEKNGLTALMKVCAKGNFSLVKQLIDQNADLKKVANNGQTAMHFACMSGNLEIIEMLFKKNISIKIKDLKCRAPLFYAIKYNHINVINLLLTYGANINEKIEKNRSYLHYLIIRRNLPMFKYLLSKKIDRNLRDQNGNTAKTLAISKGLNKFIALLDNSHSC